MSEQTGAGQAPRRPTAAILVIGDEILSGRTREGNAHHLAGALSEIGVALREIRVIGDDVEGVAAAVRALAPQVDYLFTSGGIGPTHDDMTADAVAAAFGVAIDVRADARAILEAYYGAADVNEARLRMARIPDGAELIENPVSRAPGFRIENVYVLAGVPIIFQQMLAGLLPGLAGGPPELAWSLRAAVPEGEVAEAVRAIASRGPEVSIGVYPFYRGGLGVTIVARSADRAALAAAAGALRDALLRAGAADVVEEPPADLSGA